MKGFEVEYFSEIGTGPRYRVDAETGEIAKDEVFMHGEDPLANSDTNYPGSPKNVEDAEAAEAAYDLILGADLEPGEFHVHRNGERDFRVEVYGEGAEEVADINEEFIYEATEGLDEVF